MDILKSDTFLYKFRPMDQFALSILEDNELYFASPDTLNDPFDCDLEILLSDSLEMQEKVFFDAIAESQLEQKRLSKYYLRFLDDQAEPKEYRHTPQVLYDFEYTGKKEFFKLINETEVSYIKAESELEKRTILESFYSKLVNLAKESFGICSFSATPYNIPVWSHYANNHSGVAFCFDRNYRIIKKSPGISHRKVIYSQDRRVDVGGEGWPNAFINLFTRKALDWKYEKEERLISHTGFGLRQVNRRSLRAIILGAEMERNLSDPDDKNLLLKFLSSVMNINKTLGKGEKIALYRAQKITGEFSIEISSQEDIRFVIKCFSN